MPGGTSRQRDFYATVKVASGMSLRPACLQTAERAHAADGAKDAPRLIRSVRPMNDMIEEDAFHMGLRPIDRPLVPWRDLRPLRQNTLRRTILRHVDARPLAVLRDERDRFLQADGQFFLAAARALLSMKDALWLDGRALDGRALPI